MTIEIKFEEGDTIWFIHNSKAIETIVRGIKVERMQLKESDKVRQEITYLCSKDEKEREVLIKVDEKIAYPTKEALLRSL
jgi:hypothetical protein